MKKGIRVLYHFVVLLCSFVLIYLSLVFLSLPNYLKGENKTYLFDEVLNVAFFNPDEYSVSIDNIREATDSEVSYLNILEFRYIPSYKCIDKMLLYTEDQNIAFFARAYTDDDGCVIDFYKIGTEVYAKATWVNNENVHQIKQAFFKVENLNFSEFDIEPKEAEVSLFETSENIYFGVSNVLILVLSLCLILVLQYVTYRATNKNSKKTCKNKK